MAPSGDWQFIYCNENDFTLNNLKAWWNHLSNSDLDNKSKEFQWQICHNALYTFIHLHQIDEDISRECILCNDNDEDLEHIFF